MEERTDYVIPGGVILCTAMEAREALRIPNTGVEVYSVEELCYYLYHHVFLLSRRMFTQEMADWFEKVLGMGETAQKLSSMLREKRSLKDIVVMILCSADYYTEAEIRSLIHIMDEIEQLSSVRREKVKADCYLEGGNYAEAQKRYQQVMQMEGALEFSVEEFGELLYHMALCYVNTGAFEEAVSALEEAYGKNGKKESLLARLYLLKICGREDECREVAEQADLPSKEWEEIKRNFQGLKEEARKLPIYNKVLGLFEQGDCFDTTGRILECWKDEFTKKSI